MSKVSRATYHVSRLISWLFTYMSFAIPVKRLCETDTLLAFRHPKPSYPFHVVLVPKKAVPRLEDLDAADSAFLTDLFNAVQSLVKEFGLAESGYRLIVNGGKFQDLPHLHFQLISEFPISNE